VGRSRSGGIWDHCPMESASVGHIAHDAYKRQTHSHSFTASMGGGDSGRQ